MGLEPRATVSIDGAQLGVQISGSGSGVGQGAQLMLSIFSVGRR